MMPWWKRVRYAVEYVALRLVGFVFATLPVEASSALSGGLWRLLAPLNSRHRRALLHLLAAMPEKTEAERRAIVRAMWENLGRVFAESFHLRHIIASDRIVVEAPEAMIRLAQSKHGVVICAPHMGNWDLVVAGLLRSGLQPATIYQRIKNPYVDAFVHRLRAPQFPGGLLPKGPTSSPRLMRYARRGGTVALLADLRDAKGLEVPFFGRPAPSTVFPALVARACSAPLVAVHLVRESGVRFRFRSAEVPVLRTGDRDADVAAATAALQATFEDFIRTAPEQWMWAHRRWG